MRAILAQMDQAITTQAQDAIAQAHAMTAQANPDVSPCPHHQVSAMVSHLRDFTSMNLTTFNGSKVDEDPQEFLDEVYNVLYSMGVSSSEKAELA